MDGRGVANPAEHKDAFLYGEGDEARGAKFLPATATAEEKIAKGKSVRTKFLKGLPALSRLIDACKKKAKVDGYFTVLDGRRITVRHEHAALNSLLQSAGAIICKTWLVFANRRLRAKYGEQGWTGKWAALVWSHDEVQIACRPEVAEDVAAILVQSIRDMTDHFKFRCPLDGEAKIGTTWALTH